MVFHRQLRIGNQQIRRRRTDHDRAEIVVDVEPPIAVGIGGNRHQRAGRSHQQRVAVGCRLHHSAGADRPRRARLVLHDDRLAPGLVQIVGNDARQDVGAAAGRKRHDQPDRMIGIVACRCRRNEDAKQQNKKCRDTKTHYYFSSLSAVHDLPRPMPQQQATTSSMRQPRDVASTTQISLVELTS